MIRSTYLQEVSSRRQSAVNLGTPSSVYSRTPASSMLDVEEIGCVEQAAISVIELSSGWEYNRRLDKEDSEDENVKLALRTLLSFGRQITLGMVHGIQVLKLSSIACVKYVEKFFTGILSSEEDSTQRTHCKKNSCLSEFEIEDQ